VTKQVPILAHDDLKSGVLITAQFSVICPSPAKYVCAHARPVVIDTLSLGRCGGVGFCLGSLLASKFFTCLPSRLSQIAIPINTLELYSAGTASINDAYELKTTAQKRTTLLHWNLICLLPPRLWFFWGFHSLQKRLELCPTSPGFDYCPITTFSVTHISVPFVYFSQTGFAIINGG
jgi:hypothetical protein